MFPSANVAYKVTLPNGSTFYAAGIQALDTRGAVAEHVPVPDGVYWYLMGSNTILGGYSFHATEFQPAGTSGTRFTARFYTAGDKFDPKPVVLQVVGRDQVEGDETSPVEFTDAELEDEDLIQTLMVTTLVYSGLSALVRDKLTRGYTLVGIAKDL